MRRREFIAGLGSAAWPLVARAQQQQIKVWRVGYLSPSGPSGYGKLIYDALRSKLEELGYIEGKNLILYVRGAQGDYAKLPALAAELVALGPDVTVGSGTPSTAALQHATSSIPIVMSGIADPLASGFVKSLAKPGGNITGTSALGADISVKLFEFLHAIVPDARRVAVLISPNIQLQGMVKEAYAAAAALNLTVIPFTAQTLADFDNIFTDMHKHGCDGLVVLTDARITRTIVDLANKWRLPAVYQISGYVDMGGLLSYSADFIELSRQGAVYVDKIIKGAPPAELPVEQPTRFELQVNLKTAKALGLTIPDSIIARADRVLE